MRGKQTQWMIMDGREEEGEREAGIEREEEGEREAEMDREASGERFRGRE